MKRVMVFFIIVALALALALVVGGCTSTQQTGKTISAMALTVPQLAYALDDVYAALISAKAIPDHQVEATKALAALDAIAPMVKAQGDALSGDQFNWVSFVISAAVATVKILGIWAF